MKNDLLLLALLLGACDQTPNPCDGENGRCIAAEIFSQVSGIDQLAVTADSRTLMTNSRELQFPLSMGIVLPASALATTQITIVGLDGGLARGEDTVSVAIDQRRVKFTLRALAGMNDLATDITSPGDFSLIDLAASDLVIPSEDLPASNADLLSAADLTQPIDLRPSFDYARPPTDLFQCNADLGECCGNGSTEGNEECDDGNLDNEDDCTNVCNDPVCGDGFVNGTEECDDANSSFAGCSATCMVEIQSSCTNEPQQPSMCSCNPSSCPPDFCGMINNGCGGTLSCSTC